MLVGRRQKKAHEDGKKRSGGLCRGKLSSSNLEVLGRFQAHMAQNPFSCGFEALTEEGPDVVHMELYRPYKEVFAENINWGYNRWMYIHTKSGRVYKVNMERKSNYYVLNTGWDLVVICEGLQVNQAVTLEYHGNYLVLGMQDGLGAAYEFGFGNGMRAHGDSLFGPDQMYTAEGVKINGRIVRGLSTMWAAAGGRSSMYVCIVNGSQKKNGSMFFSKQYSKVIPGRKETVALRFVGSPVAICCSIHGYRSGAIRITQGWKMFVEEHSIVEGDILVFCCYRGPAMWEMLVCRA